MSKDDKIKSLIHESLTSESSKDSYLNILHKRIEENQKSLGRLFLVLIINVLAFPLLIESKISEISIGPLKLVDSNIALLLIPSIFSFIYYKYIMIWLDLVEQKRTFKILTSEIFNIKLKSFLNIRLNFFSITDSLDRHHFVESKNTLGCITTLLFLPIILVLVLFPFIFEIYLINEAFIIFNPQSFFNWVLVITPILLTVFTLLMLVQAIKNDLKVWDE